MSQTGGARRPRISLGVLHVKETLEELVADLQEPIAVTVRRRRVAVLVPYQQYMAMAKELEEVQEAARQEAGGHSP